MTDPKDLSRRHRDTLNEIRIQPPKSNIKWDDVVSLIKALGGKIKNNDGSRRKFVLKGQMYSTHKPHPGNTMDKGAVNGLREWLDSMGIK